MGWSLKLRARSLNVENWRLGVGSGCVQFIIRYLKMVLGTFEKHGFVNVCLGVHIFLLAIYPKDMRIALSYIRHTKR